MPQEGPLRPAAPMLFELHHPYSAVGSIVSDPDEPTPFALLHCHLWHHRHSRVSGYHCQNCGELSALKDYVGLQPGPATRRKRVFAETMSLLDQQKGIAFDLIHLNPSLRCQPATPRNH